MRTRRQGGLTLVELLTALIILAVLMAIAYPSYTRYTVRGSQAAAQEFMLEVMSRAEQYRMDVRDYPDESTQDEVWNVLGVTLPDRVNDYYAVTTTTDNTANPPRFTVTAAPEAGTRQENESTLTLDSTGLRTPTEEW